MVPHAGMNGELTSPGAAYASLHNMSPQMSAAAAAAAVVAYGRSPMVGHTLHAISVVWVAGRWRRLHASFSTVEFPSYNSARALAVSLCFTLLCGWRSKSVPWEQRILVYWCMFLFFSSVLCLINKCQTAYALNEKSVSVDTNLFTGAVNTCFSFAEQDFWSVQTHQINFKVCKSLFFYLLLSPCIVFFLSKSTWGVLKLCDKVCYK